MVHVEINESGCRGCRMCVDICPTEVFEFDEPARKARVRESEDCIGCLSCSYLCPSKSITHSDFPVVKNFYRDLQFCRKKEAFL